MTEDFDREKVIDCMFDPITSEIIAQLEDGEKKLSELAKQSGISEDEVIARLSYLIEHDFVSKRTENSDTFITANSEKLTSIVESGDNFDAAVDGLTKMDGYLN